MHWNGRAQRLERCEHRCSRTDRTKHLAKRGQRRQREIQSSKCDWKTKRQIDATPRHSPEQRNPLWLWRKGHVTTAGRGQKTRNRPPNVIRDKLVVCFLTMWFFLCPTCWIFTINMICQRQVGLPKKENPTCLWHIGLFQPQEAGLRHQTTTKELRAACCWCCISFDSYIKPQRLAQLVIRSRVVYLLIPTSNHNGRCEWAFRVQLYIFWFLHQTTTGSEI